MFKHLLLFLRSRRFQAALAGLWLVCVFLTLLPWFTNVEFTHHAVSSGVHCAVWLLAWPMAQYLPQLRWVPKLLWRAVLFPLPLWFLLVFYFGIGLIPLRILAEFFLPLNINQFDWQTTHVWYRHDDAVVAQQKRGTVYDTRTGGRTVKIQPLGPLLQLVEPAERSVAPGPEWVRVDKAYVYLSADSTRQLEKDRRERGMLQCWKEWKRNDSITLQGRRPVLPLPPASRRGADVLAFVANGQVWRNRRPYFTGSTCGNSPPWCYWVPDPEKPGRGVLSLFAYMQYGESSEMFKLNISNVDPRKVNQMLLYEPSSSDNPAAMSLEYINTKEVFELRHQSTVYQDTLPPTTDPLNHLRQTQRRLHYETARLTITRLDTVAHIVSGEFEGELYKPGERTNPLVIRQGRFDVHYTYK